MALSTADKTWMLGEFGKLQDQIDKVKVQIDDLSKQENFKEGGGQHSIMGDAVLNSSYPQVADGPRKLMWVNLQQLQADLTAVKNKVLGS